MRIIGIDPGIATVGFGVVDSDGKRQSLAACGVITTPAGIGLSARLHRIYEDLLELIGHFSPDAMAVEELFFNTNQTTGISVAQGRGVILLAGYKAGVPIFEYTPLQVKQARGRLREGGKEPGHRHGTASPEPAGAAETGRRGRRRRHCTVSCQKRYVTAVSRRGGRTIFYYINGVVSVLEPGLAVLDCGGVGYALNTTTNTLSRLKTGEKAKLYTYSVIREDCFDVYGFATKAEKRSFELLLGVSGVGPRAAQSILFLHQPGEPGHGRRIRQ